MHDLFQAQSLKEQTAVELVLPLPPVFMLYRAEDFRKVKWSTSASSPAALACLITNIYPHLHFRNGGEKAVRNWKTATQIKDTVRCKTVFWAPVPTICTHHNCHVMTRVMYCRLVPAFISYKTACTAAQNTVKQPSTQNTERSPQYLAFALVDGHDQDCKKEGEIAHQRGN